MAKLVPHRQIVCPQCGEDTGSIEALGSHLLDRHAWSAPEAITTRDQVDAYCAETSGRNLLSKDAEVALGTIIQANGQRAAEAKRLLVECNLRLVVSMVRKRRGNRHKEMDLIQEGNIGLMRAADLFDPSMGLRFSTYAVWWIRQTIQRGAAQDQLVAQPIQLKPKLNQARRLLAEGQTQEQIEDQIGIGRGTLEFVLARSSARTISTDQVIASGDGDDTIGSLLAAPEEPDVVLRKDEIASVLVGLSNRERLVLVRRYGLDGKEPRTLEEIGQEIRISRERVRQVEEKALSLLKRRHDIHGTLLAGATRPGRFGMQFTSHSREATNGLTALCDGSAPVAAVETDEVANSKTEAIVANLKCEACPGMTFKNPQALGAHRRHEHPGTAGARRGRKPRKPGQQAPRIEKEKTKPEPQNGDLLGEAAGTMIVALRARRDQIIQQNPELARIDKSIAVLEELRGVAPTGAHPSQSRKDHDGSVEEDPDLPAR